MIIINALFGVPDVAGSLTFSDPSVDYFGLTYDEEHHITVDAFDDNGIAHIQLYWRGSYVGPFGDEGGGVWGLYWTPLSSDAGEDYLAAIMTDNIGNETTTQLYGTISAPG